ncbi:MAG TPA: acetyl-CoA carboxylase biotin carboxyl carrier protein [Gemmatimonadaceae bacterium]|jgi:acetyl-CoA carboxylase biotin carboxyl carrier protein|nr:acetyl-CoA carboxylase biotin carboxyl carrier protein [Gemmatimonadaceae bacterium]
MIDLRYVKKLIEMIDGSTVDSIEISSDKGLKIRISKSSSGRGAVQMAAPMAAPPMMAAQPDPRLSPAMGVAAVPAEPAPSAAPAPPAAPAGVEVKSPMVGTFYAAGEPGAKPYAAVGTRVAKGQVLCIIEAMKIMNEIESEHAGVVTAVLVEDSAPVEYGQVLFQIDPNG